MDRMKSVSMLAGPPPSFATPPDPAAWHQLRSISRTSRALGSPLMPWQRYVARVASEVIPPGQSTRALLSRVDFPRWRYPTVVLTVPRQAGKTTLLHAIQVQRAITRDRCLIMYTAQTGLDASDKWNELYETIDLSPLSALVHPRLSAGSQSLTWPNLSRIRPFAPTKTGIHGKTPPLVMLDEAFSHDLATGVMLEGAIKPAQQTIPDRQVWIVSTAGSPESTWLKSWVDRGRDAITDPNSGIAYFEWSAPTESDLYDPATWWEYHPALGFTITEETLREDARTTPPGEWRRAYGNLWGGAAEPIMARADWDALQTPLEWLPVPASPVGLAYDVAHDRTDAALWAAWLDANGKAVLRVVRHGRGITWLPDAVRAALQVMPGAVLGAHDQGPVRQITAELQRAGLTPTLVNTRDHATASGVLLWRAKTEGMLTHDGSPALWNALSVAETRPTGESWAWSALHSSGSIAALNAATIALRLAETRPSFELPRIRGAK